MFVFVWEGLEESLVMLRGAKVIRNLCQLLSVVTGLLSQHQIINVALMALVCLTIYISVHICSSTGKAVLILSLLTCCHLNVKVP